GCGGATEEARIFQKGIENQATLRYLKQGRADLPANGPTEWHEQEGASENMTVRSPAWNFSKIPIFAPDRANQPQVRSPLGPLPLPGVMQAKLTIGDVNDPLEHEADRIANQVMHTPDIGAVGSP